MDNCSRIKANVRMEERYAGLSLACGCDKEVQQEVLDAIEEIKQQMGVTPTVFDNPNKDCPEKEGFYIEFDDDYDREAGEFFQKLLKKLKIDKCEE